jgi:hypothetical protein
VALIGGYFIYSAFVEEPNMTRLFPSAYPEYQQSTKMLIPLRVQFTFGRLGALQDSCAYRAAVWPDG